MKKLKMNRCIPASPSPDFVNIRQFEEWLDYQRARKEPSKSDKVLAKYCDEYAVFYQTSEGIIEELSFCISSTRLGTFRR